MPSALDSTPAGRAILHREDDQRPDEPMKARTISKKTPSPTRASPPPVEQRPTRTSAPGALPPSLGTLPMPARWIVPKPNRRNAKRGLRPRGGQVDAAQRVASELAASRTYESDFGALAPSRERLAFLLENAAQWRACWNEAVRYLAYCASQRAAWEDEGLRQMALLKPIFAILQDRDGTRAAKYSATEAYLNEGIVITKRGVASRNAKTRAKARAAAKAR